MIPPGMRGINCQGLSLAFEKEEVRKSNLILEAAMLRDFGQLDEAAVKLAEAAPIEELLSETCDQHKLREKAMIHLLSALNCWAQAGNLYRAITLGEQALARPDLTDRLRQHVVETLETLRRRRIQWHEESTQRTLTAAS